MLLFRKPTHEWVVLRTILKPFVTLEGTLRLLEDPLRPLEGRIFLLRQNHVVNVATTTAALLPGTT